MNYCSDEMKEGERDPATAIDFFLGAKMCQAGNYKHTAALRVIFL